MCGTPFHIRSASQRSGALKEEDDYLSVALEERFRLDTQRLEWAEEILKRAPRVFHAANRLHVQPSTWGRQLKVAMRHR